MTQVALRDVCVQARDQIRPGERTDLKYVGLESVEAGTGAFVDGELSKTPEDPRAASFHFDERHVLYGKLRPYLNKVVAPNFEGKCSTELVPLLPSDSLDRLYLAYFLRSKATVEAVVARTAGARMPRADMSHLLGLRIPLPTLLEQKRVVDLLSRAEGIVRLRREAQHKAAELVPALFLDMFGDPASNPKAWQTVSLSEVSTVGSGAGFPIADQGRDTGDYPFYKVGDMNLPGNEEAMSSSRNYIDEATRSRLRATAFSPGAVIFPKIGAAIATNKKRVLSIPSCVDNNVMAVVPSDRLLPSYLHALFMHADLSDFASDSNPPSIRKTTIEAWRIPLPPVDLQRQFAAKVDAVRGIAAQQTVALATAQATFDALLHQSFQH